MPDNLTVTIGADSTKLRADLALAQSSLRQFARELKTAADAARQTGDTTQVQAAAQRYQAVETRVRSLSREIRGTAQAHAEAAPAIAALGTHLTNLGSKAREAGTAFNEMADRTFPHWREIVVLSLAGATAALAKFTSDAAKSTLAAKDLAESLGLLPDELQALNLAAAKIDIAPEEITGAVRRLRNLFGATEMAQDLARKTGSELGKIYVDAFGHTARVMSGDLQTESPLRMLGMTPGGLDVASKDTLRGVQEVARLLERVKGARQADIAEQLFGKNWPRMLGLFTQLGPAYAKATQDMIPLTNAEEQQAKAFQATYAVISNTVSRMRDIIGNTFGQALLPAFQNFNALLRSNQGNITQWATAAGKALYEFVRGIDPGAVFREISSGATAAVGAFHVLGEAAQRVADAINSLFGTHFTATGVAMVAIIIQLSGAFTTLAAAIRLAVVAGKTLFALGSLIFLNPGAAAIIIGVALALTDLAIIGLAIYRNWEPIKGLFSSIWQGWVEFSNWIVGTFLGVIDSVVQKATSAISAVGKFLGITSTESSASGSATAATGVAAGGYIRGPGTGTSDSIPARLSAGEFVINAASVRALGVGFLHGLNSLAQGGLVTAPPVGFAAGGLVSAGSASGRPVHLHLGSQSYALQGSESVVDALVSHAYSQNMRSAGVKPTWFAGRPGG